MGILPQHLPLELMQTQWASFINPVLTNTLLQGQLLNGIVLASGSNVVNHKLSRQQLGWFITDINGTATIYRSKPFNSTTLTLTSSAAVTVSLWVF